MAVGTKLKMVFETPSGQKTWTFNRAKPSATTAQIKNLANTMITNGDIYRYTPLQAVEASFETTTVTNIDLS